MLKRGLAIKSTTLKYVIYANVMLPLLLVCIKTYEHTSHYRKYKYFCQLLWHAWNWDTFSNYKSNHQRRNLKSLWIILERFFSCYLGLYNSLHFVGSLFESQTVKTISSLFDICHWSKEMRNCWVQMLATKWHKWFYITSMKNFTFSWSCT